ncbi:unnamed protein product, partial [marine sediment metagenome]
MAKRKRKKRKVGLTPFTWGLPKKAKSQKIDFNLSDLTVTLKIAAVICVVAGIVI